MADDAYRRVADAQRRWMVTTALVLGLVATPVVTLGQTSSSSRPLSSTVISTYVARDGTLALLVLWRGSPGWYSRGGGHSSSGGGGGSPGGQIGSVSLTYGGKTLSIDFDYTARQARLLGRQISLAETNVVLVDGVDAPSGAQIVGYRWVDPTLPEVANDGQRTLADDPAVAAIRRAPELGAFLQCDVPLPEAAGVDPSGVDPTAVARLTEYMQNLMTQNCRAALGPG